MTLSISPLPPPPSRAVPATFAALADTFLGQLPTFADEANALAVEVNALAAGAGYPNAQALYNAASNFGLSGAWMTYGGTANALTLTSISASLVTAYADGAQYRFKAGTTNTGPSTLAIDGLPAKALLTVTGVALPAGYIRTTAETVARYDLASDSFIADRQPETSTGSTGGYLKLANGVAEGWAVNAPPSNNNGGTTCTSPVTFIDTSFSLTSSPGTVAAGTLGSSIVVENRVLSSSTFGVKMLIHTATTIVDSPSVPIHTHLKGRWY